MRILLTGGTGLVGSSVLQALLASGHEVSAIVRSHDAAAKVEAAGAHGVIGDLTDRDWLIGRLRDAEGAIHAATDNSGPGMDEVVTDAVIAAFSRTDKPYVHTGGVWVWGDGADIAEDSELHPPQITAWRLPIERKLLDSGVRATVIAPAIVYGPQGEGIPGMLANGPRDADGALVLIGDGTQHWATVAASDLGELYVLALERSTGGVYIGASGANPTVRDLAEAVVGDGGAVATESNADARARLGDALAEALLLDQSASGSKARTDLGWEPNAPSLVRVLAS